jgi:hypothetical protein
MERRVLVLSENGETEEQIGRRFRRSPDFIGRVLVLARLDGRHAEPPPHRGLSPIERRVLWWRDRGASFDELANRFRRSVGHMERVEGLARYRAKRGGA